MEFKNEVTLQGIVGNIHVQSYDNVKMARLSVATNETYTSKDGCAVIATTWHNVTAWENPTKPGNITALDTISKGDKVRVTGAIVNKKYIAPDGSERTTTEIKAKTLGHVND